MRIAVRGVGSRKLVRKLEKSGVTELVGGTHNDLFFDSFWPNDRLGEFLREAARYDSFDLNPRMEFSQADIAKANFLRIRPRKVVEESTHDYECMSADFDELPWIGSDAMRRIRLPGRISLSKIRLKPNQVAVVGQWTAEFVVPSIIRTIFETGDFSGVDFRPILHTRTSMPFEEYFHLYSDHILGYRELDIASPAIQSTHPEEQSFDALGCICYKRATLENALDFNRTGEKMKSFQFPDWVVSAAVRSCFLEHKLKGWAFEPVLEIGTQAHDDYNEIWTSYYALLAECERHTVRGQKPGPPTAAIH